MKVAVIANGQWDKTWGRTELSDLDLLIAADGGCNHAMEVGFIPDVLIGDLDSVLPENLERCRQTGALVLQYPREKDETDLELALKYASNRLRQKDPKQTSLLLYAATGGRVDHLLGNLGLLMHYHKQGITVRIKDSLHEIWLNSESERIPGQLGQEISLIPITESATVRTEGLYYPLVNEQLRLDSPRGISNVFVSEEALIEVGSGIVLIVLLSMTHGS